MTTGAREQAGAGWDALVAEAVAALAAGAVADGVLQGLCAAVADQATSPPSAPPDAPGPDTAALRALTCPYCGAAVTVNLETVGSAYLTYEQVESIECDALDCEAVWEPQGEPRDLPRWLRYPDLYTAPERAT